MLTTFLQEPLRLIKGGSTSIHHICIELNSVINILVKTLQSGTI